jgi:flagellar hook-associated protein 2
MGLRFDPIGGGQFKQAVKQLVEIEQQPIKALEARKAKEDTKMKLFQEFKAKFQGLTKALNEISSFRKFRELKVDLGDGANLATVTLDKDKAEPGQYSIEIDELATRTSVVSSGFDNPDETKMGMGFLSVENDLGDAYEVYIDDRESSLRGIAAAINRDQEAPVRATVIKDASDPETPWKLLITGKKDGAANQLDTLEFNFTDADDDLDLEADREAKNASLIVDGFPMESESNDLNDFLPGVNLHLKQARPDQPFILTITEDYQKIAGKMKNLVDQINTILGFIYKQNAIDDKSDTTTTFAGDSSLQTMEYMIRNVLHQGFKIGHSSGSDDDSNSTQVLYLHEMGIEFDKGGQVQFKEDKFNKTLENNFDKIGQAISGPEGFVAKLKGLVDNYTQSVNGILQIKEQGMRSRMQQLDNDIDAKTRLVEQKAQNITDKFSRLEGSIGALQRQQQYLAANLPGAGGGGNPITQLLG